MGMTKLYWLMQLTLKKTPVKKKSQRNQRYLSYDLTSKHEFYRIILNNY